MCFLFAQKDNFEDNIFQNLNHYIQFFLITTADLVETR